MAVTMRKPHHPLYYDLAGIVGPAYVSDTDFALETYSRDTSPLPPNKQGIVVRPVNTDQVVDIVKLSNSSKIPIVVSGGRASFYGTPKGLHGKGIVVDMTRMNKMIKIDFDNLTATAEAGMTTSELTTKLWDVGWDVHTAFQPWYSDTLGGQISGFAGGGNGFEMCYTGFNGTHIPGVKLVLPDASIVQTGAGAGNSVFNQGIIYDKYPGNPDLTGLFVGDAGTFGIKVEATYRMYKYSPHRHVVAHYFDSFEQAWEAMKALTIVEPLPFIISTVITPTELTRMRGMSKYLIMTVAKGWTEKELASKMEIIEDIMTAHKAVVAAGPQVEEWKDAAITGRRHREMGEFGTPGTWSFFEYYCARSQVEDCHHTMRKFIYDRLNKHSISHVSNEGLIGSLASAWIITTIIWVRGDDKKSREVMQDLFAEATELACSHGWFPDCHQGWGTRMMAKYWPSSRYEFMKKLKKAVDPNNIMNPGVWDF